MAGVLAVLPALIVAGIRINKQQQTLRTAGLELQLALLNDLAENCEHTLDQARADLEAIALTLTRANLDDNARLELALTFVESSAMVDHVEVYDRNGQWVDRIEQNIKIPPAPLTLNPRERHRLQQQGKVLGDVQRFDSQLRVPMTISLVVDTQVTGYLRSAIALGPLQQRLEYLARGHLSGLSDALYIVDNQRRIIAHTSRDRLLASAEDDPMIAPLNFDLMAPQVGLSREVPDSPQSEGFVGTALKLKHRPWVLATRVPISVAYRPWLDQRRLLFYLIGATIVLALVLGTVFARFITEPLIALRQMASRLVKHRFDHTALLEREDELGQLAQAMQQAAIDLRSDTSDRSDASDRLQPGQSADDLSLLQAQMGAEQPKTIRFRANLALRAPEKPGRYKSPTLRPHPPAPPPSASSSWEQYPAPSPKRIDEISAKPSAEQSVGPGSAWIAPLSISIPDDFVQAYGPEPAAEVHDAMMASLREYLEPQPAATLAQFYPSAQLLLLWPSRERCDPRSILHTLSQLQQICIEHPECETLAPNEQPQLICGLHWGEVTLVATAEDPTTRVWGRAVGQALAAQAPAPRATIWVSGAAKRAASPHLSWIQSSAAPAPTVKTDDSQEMSSNSPHWVLRELS